MAKVKALASFMSKQIFRGEVYDLSDKELKELGENNFEPYVPVVEISFSAPPNSVPVFTDADIEALGSMTVAALKEKADSLDVKYPGSILKEDLINLLRAKMLEYSENKVMKTSDVTKK